VLVQILSNARRHVETKRAAAREKHRVHLLHEVHRIEQIRFDRSRGGPAHIDTRNSAGFRQDHRAAGRPLAARKVSNLETGTSVSPEFIDMPDAFPLLLSRDWTG
jgi:hypothetical protein